MSERDEFEADYARLAVAEGFEMTAADIAKRRVGNTYGDKDSYLNGCWDGWQARAAVSVWRPIDSAPKDEYVLTTGFIGNDPALGRWQDVAKGEADLWFCQTEDQLHPPTHWKPLDAPPATGGEG